MHKLCRTEIPPNPGLPNHGSPVLQLSTRLNLEQIYVMGHCPPELLRDSILEVESHKQPTTATCLLENVFCRLVVCNTHMFHSTYFFLPEVLTKLSESDCHDLVVCFGSLAYLKTVNSVVTVSQFSNELLSINACREGWPDLNTLGLLTKSKIFDYTTGNDTEVPDFIHITIQNFLCALYLCKQPFVAVQRFVFEHLLSKQTIQDPNHERVLELYCGLIGKIAPTTASPMIYCLISYVCQTIDGSQPICNSDIILLIFSCLHEAQNVDCVVKVDENLLTSRLFVYSVAEVREKVDAIAYYFRQTQQNAWKIFSTDPVAKELQSAIMKLKGYVLHKAPPMPSGIVIITTKEFFEIESPLIERFTHQVKIDDGSHDEIELLTPPVPGNIEGAVAYSTSESQSPHYYASSYAPSCVPRSAYGYLSTAEYESRQYYRYQTHYAMLKDVLVISLQPSSLSFVEGQYRKKDHMWFSVSRNVRADFYEEVQISPIPVVHWVKVKQPNGSKSLEEKIEKEALEQRSTYSQETAELVILNSHLPNSIFLSSSSEPAPLVIAFDRDSGAADPGEIGCDGFLTMHAAQEVVINGMQFDIKKDRVVPRQLPLPASKSKQERSIETETTAEKPTPVREETVPPRAPAAVPQTPLESHPPPAAGSQPTVTSQQLKQDALKGFDYPGYCFFVDSNYSFLLHFRQGQVYPLPESLPGSRVLREGGNGLILDVTVNGHMCIVKKTAFRLREIMIMPRLKHNNILRVMAMLVGPAMPDYPRRRFVYHFYKKMKGDLGRLVGSYEKYCMRTLNERYRDEPLLLISVHANVQHIAHSLLLGLNYLHTLTPKMVVHRDVKPSNVLVNMLCACPNPLVCVCRSKPEIVLSDFDASLELSKDRLQPNSYQSSNLVYHVSPVGTIGFKSPEGCLHCVGNDLDVMPLVTTKLDIFSFGLLMMVLLLNTDGPRHLQQMGTLLLSMNQSTTRPRQRLTDRQKEVLLRHGVYKYRSVEPYVGTKELDNVLPVQRVKQEFSDQLPLCDFMEKCLKIDPRDRSTAAELLQHDFLSNYSVNNRS